MSGGKGKGGQRKGGGKGGKKCPDCKLLCAFLWGGLLSHNMLSVEHVVFFNVPL